MDWGLPCSRGVPYRCPLIARALYRSGNAPLDWSSNLTGAALVVRYTLFAILATATNLGAQRVVLEIDRSDAGFLLALCTGTLTGLFVKYMLDKRWIFHDTRTGLRTHGRLFARYTMMGIFTTLIFWGTETAFWLVARTDTMRELGAVLGLAVGYFLKYRLDRRYVFGDR